MPRTERLRSWVSMFSILSLLLTGCIKDLVRDDVKIAKTGVHRSGSESMDDSSIAVLPVPLAAFFVLHFDLHEIKADQYLQRCGDSTTLINRNLTINRTGCIPAGLTRVIPSAFGNGVRPTYRGRQT